MLINAQETAKIESSVNSIQPTQTKKNTEQEPPLTLTGDVEVSSAQCTNWKETEDMIRIYTNIQKENTKELTSIMSSIVEPKEKEDLTYFLTLAKDIERKPIEERDSIEKIMNIMNRATLKANIKITERLTSAICLISKNIYTKFLFEAYSSAKLDFFYECIRITKKYSILYNRVGNAKNLIKNLRENIEPSKIEKNGSVKHFSKEERLAKVEQSPGIEKLIKWLVNTYGVYNYFHGEYSYIAHDLQAECQRTSAALTKYAQLLTAEQNV